MFRIEKKSQTKERMDEFPDSGHHTGYHLYDEVFDDQILVDYPNNVVGVKQSTRAVVYQSRGAVYDVDYSVVSWCY